MLAINQEAPLFNLEDQDGSMHSLKDYSGKNLILYFYPKDDTPGCTTEACSFRDSFKDLVDSGITVLGIGKGNRNDHKKFQQKYSLPFTLLVDKGYEVCKAYDVLQEKSMFGKSFDSIKRTTFLIGKDGKVLKIWEGVNPSNHANLILKDIKDLEQLQ